MTTGRMHALPPAPPRRPSPVRVSPLQLLLGAFGGLLLAIAALAAGLRFGDYLVERDQAEISIRNTCSAETPAPRGSRT